MTAEQRAKIRLYLESKEGRNRRPIDGDKVECENCGSQEELEWHHKTPRSKGGDDSSDNLQVGDDHRFGQKFTQMLGPGSFPASAEAVFEQAGPEALYAPAPIRTGLLALRRRIAPPPSSHRGVSQNSCEPS